MTGKEKMKFIILKDKVVFNDIIKFYYFAIIFAVFGKRPYLLNGYMYLFAIAIYVIFSYYISKKTLHTVELMLVAKDKQK